MTDVFGYWGEPYEYETGAYNDARLNERAVEIPIARAFVDARAGVGLELGNVLAHYAVPRVRFVVDRYEQGDVSNIDVFDLDMKYDWIVAISTVEHVRWDEPGLDREWDGSVRAIEHLYGLLRPGGRMLITVPMGWNPYLDTAILDGKIIPPERQCTMVRVGDGWLQTPELDHRRYAATTVWAESVWIAEWRKL